MAEEPVVPGKIITPETGGGGSGGEDNGEGTPSHVEPDWKELLRLERERADKAESDRDIYKGGLQEYKRREKAKKEEPVEVEGLDDKIQTAIARGLAPIAESLKGNKVETILASIVTDPAKREYVKGLYETRIQKTGNSDEAIRQDIESALAIADSKKFAKENEELKRMSDNNKIYVPPTSGGGGGDKGIPQKAYKWSPEQERHLEQRAMMNGITDVEKYKALAWRASQEGTAFDLKEKYI